ncbi:hypothetical protein TRFO_18368 [Tritrichomonas foetus]|uniref:Ubiquitin-like domain-containing protein n=1 Tax=Tritrichomonas foetus TaxID=1144522 RepID=A0A1J4KL01_9EUKA|nr:hypothetical protein TRFO_18368 [Tritrichomonas foetus]|eukprot:OHT11985.1 hypothetical protein TRFO_18368 [Tritrichomonas foetus]
MEHQEYEPSIITITVADLILKVSIPLLATAGDLLRLARSALGKTIPFLIFDRKVLEPHLSLKFQGVRPGSNVVAYVYRRSPFIARRKAAISHSHSHGQINGFKPQACQINKHLSGEIPKISFNASNQTPMHNSPNVFDDQINIEKFNLFDMPQNCKYQISGEFDEDPEMQAVMSLQLTDEYEKQEAMNKHMESLLNVVLLTNDRILNHLESNPRNISNLMSIFDSKDDDEKNEESQFETVIPQISKHASSDPLPVIFHTSTIPTRMQLAPGSDFQQRGWTW